MMKRDLCIAELARHRGEDIVVAVFHAAFDLLRIQPHALNYYFVGAMGLASSHGLGIALGRPDKRVLVLDGDGSLLMNLGSLVTIGAAAPKNLVHFVFENGTYEANGAHPIPGQGKVDFVGLARAAGYRACYEFAELKEFSDQIGTVLLQDGPVFVNLKVEPGEYSPLAYAHMYSAALREVFRTALRASADSR